jgi:hypothetical protein
MKLIPESLQDFERTSNPIRALDIGKASMVKDIDSDDLDLMLVGYDGKTHSWETFWRKGQGRFEDKIEAEGYYERSERYWDLLKDHIQIPKRSFEYDQTESLERYITTEMKKDPQKKYAYDCNPGGNYIHILFSDIELPSAMTAEELIQDI